MDKEGAFTHRTEDTYTSGGGKVTITLITDQEGQMLRIQFWGQQLLLGIQSFDEVVSAVEVLQDRSRARRNGR